MWRMCVVWDRARPICAFGAILLVATLGLNVANIAVRARDYSSVNSIPYEGADAIGNAGGLSQLGVGSREEYYSEAFAIYDGNFIGLSAALLSLASNLCATILVGIKAWCVTITA